ncbi:MAG: EAL domain-containing protein [Methylophagaceae bacterium]
MKSSLITLLIAITFVFTNLTFAANGVEEPQLELVKLQLKWTHQFQFAGYYAAKEQGYYASEGLDVVFLERLVGTDPVAEVTSGTAEYGIGSSGLLLDYANGAPIKAIAAIFQHNPLVFFSKKSSGITQPSEMKGQRVMFDTQAEEQAPLKSLLMDAGLTQNDFISLKHTHNLDELSNNTVDVISGYLSSGLHYYAAQGIDVNVINPQDYGIDFYGDIIFTSTQELTKNPDRVHRFLRASLKGWEYALSHQEELVQLIHKKYPNKFSLDTLRNEANETEKLISANIIPLGDILSRRLQREMEVYSQLNLSRNISTKDIDDFIFNLPHKIRFSHYETTWLNEHPNLRFVGDPHWLPYEAFDENGDYIGIVAEHIKLIENHSGIKFNIVPTSTWQESVQKVRSGEVDIISETTDSVLSEKLSFTKPYHFSPIVMVMRKEQDYIDGIKQIKNKKIALVRDYGYTRQITQAYPNIKFHWFNNVEQALAAVSSGRVDALLATLTHASYQIPKFAVPNIHIVGKTEFQIELALGVKKQYAPLIPILNRAFDSISEEKRKQIFNQWGEAPHTETINYRLILQITAGLLLLLFIVLYWNRTLRKQIKARELIQEELKKLSLAVEYSPNAVMITDKNILIEYINPKFTEITGFSADDVIGKKPSLFNRVKSMPELWDTLLSGKEWREEIESIKKDGTAYWARQSIVPISNNIGDITHFVSMHEDITESKRINEEISHRASHDMLTGLINRSEFEHRLTRVVDTSKKDFTTHALCFLDLDQFKIVNDTSGHVAGDELLRQLGTLLRSHIRQRDTLARIGGDEFAILMEHCGADQASRAAEAVRKLIENFQFDWEDRSYRIGVSIGVALITNSTKDSTEALKHADLACYTAKDHGRNRVHIYQSGDENQTKQESDIHWAARTTEALEHDYFTLFVQPIQPLLNPDISPAYEVLIRLIEPGNNEIIPPGAFLPAVERYNLACKLDLWVIDHVFEWISNNISKLDNIHHFSINLSGQSLGDETLLGHVITRLNNRRLPAEKISFEITETAAITNLRDATNFMTILKSHGCSFALDDFGSGLSSFAYLKNLPVDYLKIDGMFVRDILSDPIDAAMVRSINDIGHVMGIQTIAEFVENKQTQQRLTEMGVDYAQGYVISKPFPIDDLLK